MSYIYQNLFGKKSATDLPMKEDTMSNLKVRDVLRFGRTAALTGALLASLGASALAEGMKHSVQAGDIMIEGAFSRATLPNQPVAGAFMVLKNMGDEMDTLIAGETPIAGRVEIHEMAMSGDVMKMRQLEDGLEIPAGETVELKPGGFHVMFFDLTQSLTEGEMIEVTLEFEKGGKVTVPIMVGARDADGAKHNH